MCPSPNQESRAKNIKQGEMPCIDIQVAIDKSGPMISVGDLVYDSIQAHNRDLNRQWSGSPDDLTIQKNQVEIAFRTGQKLKLNVQPGFALLEFPNGLIPPEFYEGAEDPDLNETTWMVVLEKNYRALLRSIEQYKALVDNTRELFK